MSEVIKLSGITKQYGKKKVVENVNLTVEKGHIYGLIGPNGAGKTTIMKMLAGLSLPTEGSIELFGSGEHFDENRARTSFMLEAPHIEKGFTARENMEYIRRLRGVADKGKVDEILEIVGLANTGKKLTKHFSLGMKQRLAIGMSLMSDPELMVLDEPVNGLDPEGIVEVRHLLQKLRDEKGVTILISSHLLSELSELCTDFTIIDKGKIVESLSKQQLEDNCRNYIAIRTDNQEKLATVLEQNLRIKEYVVREDNEIRVYEKLDDVATISKTITDAGLVILKFNGEGENLEEYFLSKVTSGGSNQEESKGRFSRLFRKAGA